MQLTMFAPASESPPALSSGKSSPASSAIKATPSDAFLVRLLGKTANCSLQGGGGRTLVVCLDPSAQSRGGSWTPNISAWPNDAAVCSLSQVLETGSIPPRFFLSGTACAGILRRADKRGKTLPPALSAALTAVATSTSAVRPAPARAGPGWRPRPCAPARPQRPAASRLRRARTGPARARARP